MSFFNELKRRNVFRVAITYLAAAWLLTEIADTLFGAFGVPDWATRFIVIALALGFLPALIFSWAVRYPPNSIAVLPFVNMSSDVEQEFFSDGISEELLNLLARLPELQVIARTSSFAFKGKEVTIAEIARELNVVPCVDPAIKCASPRS